MLQYYGNMSYQDILNSSRPYLNGIYQQYVRRACENLGVSPDGKENDSDTKLKDSDYPNEFVSFTQAQRQQIIAESGQTDEEFLSSFNKLK